MYFNNCGNSGINKTFILEPMTTTGGTPVISACTAVFTNKVESCDSNTEILLLSGETVFNTDILPINDNELSIGYPTRRFRELNSFSGTTSIWSATTRVVTPELQLGLDSSGNTRTITADNSVIQDDILNGGTF